MGRPPKSADERKAAALTLRLTQAERDAAEMAAERTGMKISDWVRKIVAEASANQESGSTEGVPGNVIPRG